MRSSTPLRAAMRSDTAPLWPGARWIGVLDTAELPGAPVDGPDHIGVQDAVGYGTARLLIRQDGLVRGFVEAAIEGVDGSTHLDAAAVRAAIETLPPPDPAPADTPLTPATVVICTRDRADQLADALASVLALDHPHFEVVVVDNAPRTDDTRELVTRLALDSPVPLRVVTEPRPGLATARNTGLRAATGDIVAFTDDDVVVDPAWLRRLADGFARRPDVGCVSGLVPSGEVRTPVQAYFEQRVSWASSCRARVFRLADPPADVPLFPFQVGLYGTGANFALRREVVFALGGFDEALGVGSPTCGGEDIDMFVRVVVAGHALAYEPSALVWHRHRADMDALAHQASGYGIGLGAWLTKVALDPSLNRLALRRAVSGARRARDLAAPAPAASDPTIESAVREALLVVGKAERNGALAGPLRYLRARRSGAQRRPLDPAGEAR